MARIRTIKPDFWTDEKVVELSAFARLLFIGLWNFADDEGRMEYSPKRIKMQILPADSAEIPRLMEELRALGLITIYCVESIDYLQIAGFAKHQKVDKRSPSKYPPPANSPRVPPTEGKGMEGNGREGKETTPAVPIETTPASEAPAGVVPPDGGEATQTPPPDPAVHAAVEALRVGLAVGTAQHERAGELWGVMSANGVRGTACHPAVVEMVRDGVTVEELRKAIAEAKKSNEGQLSPPYLAAIIERLRTNPAKPNGKAAAWATDERATEAKARELGLWPARGGESWDGLRNRIRTKLATKAEEAVR